MGEPAFAAWVSSSVHECAPDHSVQTVEVGKLREAADTISALYEALEVCLAMAQRKSLTSPLNLNGQSPYDIGIAALRLARGESPQQGSDL